MMEAFVRPQNRRMLLEKRFDYLALVPAAAAICYPFLLNAFHAIVGTQAVSPPPLAIAEATFILFVAFGVPFLGIALACRPTSNPGSRRLAYASVVSQRSMSFSALLTYGGQFSVSCNKVEAHIAKLMQRDPPAPRIPR